MSSTTNNAVVPTNQKVSAVVGCQGKKIVSCGCFGTTRIWLREHTPMPYDSADPQYCLCTWVNYLYPAITVTGNFTATAMCN